MQTVPRTAWRVDVMLRTCICIILGLFVATSTFGSEARAERRVALVIGNATYAYAPVLRNPRNDATDIAAELRKVGFEVVLGLDLDQQHFADTIQRFSGILNDADVALFYYSGHALQINGKNYLVSVNARLDNEFLISSETIGLDAIVRLMEFRVPMNLIFLDASRNNPLAEDLKKNLVAMHRGNELERGLARIEPTGRDTLIAFAAAPGEEAADGNGRNSPFTATLLKYIPQPNLEVSVMLKSVAAEVRENTRNAQRSQQLSDMSRTFYLVKPDTEVASAVPPAPSNWEPTPPAMPRAAAPNSNADAMIEVAFWIAAHNANNCGAIRAYMQRFPNGIFIALEKLSERRLCYAVEDRHVAILQAAPDAQNNPQTASPPHLVAAAPTLAPLPPAPMLTPPPAAPTPVQQPRPAANAFTNAPVPPAGSAKAPLAQPPRPQQAFAVNPAGQPSHSANGDGRLTTASVTSAPAAAPPERKIKIVPLPKPKPAGSQPTKEVDRAPIHADIARDLQRELDRVGCSVGDVDGNWGPRSRNALRQFNHYARLRLNPVPSENALEALQKRHGRVCPAAAERRPPGGRRSRSHRSGQPFWR